VTIASNPEIAQQEATAAPSEQSCLWTAKEAAKFLQVHDRTVTRKAKVGEIPGFQIGRCWRFVPEDLRRWAREQSSKSQLSPRPPQ